MESNILHIDMNAFFASVEQTANPFIANRPIAVGDPHYANSALVAVSYEARRKGVKNLSRAIEARSICPELLIVPFDPLKYYSVNTQIVKILREYTPTVEVYSIDEAFLDLTPVLHLHRKSPVEIAYEIKHRIVDEVGFKLTSSVGVGANKLLAKVGSDWEKPDGLTVIPWDQRLEFLDKLDIGDIWGIGFRSTAKFHKLGITSTKQIREMPDSTLRALVGSYYTRLRMVANGLHYDPVDPGRSQRPHKSMQHAHTMSKPTKDPKYLATVIRKMSERLAVRLRKHGQMTRTVHLGLRPANQKTYGWGYLPTYSGAQDLDFPTSNGYQIYQAALKVFSRFDLEDNSIRLVAVGISNLDSKQALVFDIFREPEQEALDQAIDQINGTYGGFTIRTADILKQRAKERELSVFKEDMVFHPE